MRNSSAMLNDILNSAIAAIYSFRVCDDGRWEYEYWSAGCETVFGYTPQDFMSDKMLWKSRVLPEDLRELMQHASTDGTLQFNGTVEYRFRHKDSTHRWISCNFSSRRDDISNVWVVTAVCTDITSRKQAEAALRQSEARYRTFCELTSDYIYSSLISPEGTVIEEWATPNMSRITGYAHEELFDGTRTWFDIIYPDDLSTACAFFNNLLQQKYSGTLEYRIVTKQGEIRWIRDRVQPQWDDTEQRVVRVLGAVEDISDRKQIETALRESEQRYATLTQAVPVGIFRTDSEGNCLYVNERWCQITGLTPQEARQAGWVQALHPDDRERVFTQWYQSAQQNLPFQSEYRFRRVDGVTTWVFGQAVPESGVNRELLGYVGTITDISDRKQAEQKIQEQAVLLDVATDAIFVRDLEHHILFWNKGAESLYGWSAMEALGKKATQMFSEQVMAQIETALNTAIEQGKWQGELQHVTKDGKQLIVQSRWTLVRDETGQPKSILAVNTDITEKKQLEAQFLRAQRLENLGILASGIAYDLNNILQPILTTAQLLKLKLPDADERYRQILLTLETSAKRGADVVKQILTFARGAEGKRAIVQVRHLLKDLEQLAKQTFPKSIEIATDVPPDLWTVSADVTQLHQVLMNLAVNARDAMPDGGTLSLAAVNLRMDETYARMNVEAKVGDYVMVTVADTGCGIPPEIIDRIFDPFFTTKELGKGTGLGLSTVLGIVKNHGGFVQVESQVGKGTQFRVYLPIGVSSADRQSPQLEMLAGQGELILIVDDEVAVQQITQTSLETYNYRTLIASDGIEAIALYADRQQQIDLVLMDVMMPSMDGLTAIRTLQRMNPQVKIIATSGLASNNQLAKAAAINIQAFLSKPYTLKELLDTLHRILGAP